MFSKYFISLWITLLPRRRCWSLQPTTRCGERQFQNVFEKEDLWDCSVHVEDEDGDIEEEAQPPTRQEIIAARKRRVRAHWALESYVV